MKKSVQCPFKNSTEPVFSVMLVLQGSDAVLERDSGCMVQYFVPVVSGISK